MTTTAPQPSPNFQVLQDFYEIESLFNPAELVIRDRVREYVSSEIMPYIKDWWSTAQFPPHLPQAFGELGILGMTIPEQYGGAGASHLAYGLVNRELEFADSGMRSFVSVQSGLVMWPIYTYGSDALKSRWLSPLASGNAIGCFGLTEPGAGSDPGNMQTRVRKVGNRYVLNGRKRWVTNGTIADVAIIWAKDEDTEQVLGFAIDTNTEGLSTVDITSKMSMRASISSELYLHDVEVTEEARLEIIGLRGALSCLNQARFGISFGVLGAATACFEEATTYVAKRPAFETPLATKQLIQARLADMLTGLTKGTLLAFHLARLKGEGRDSPSRVSLAKRENVRAAVQIARSTRDLLGANGITTEYTTIRHMLNLEAISTYEGTDNIHTLVLGREITGQHAF